MIDEGTSELDVSSARESVVGYKDIEEEEEGRSLSTFSDKEAESKDLASIEKSGAVEGEEEGDVSITLVDPVEKENDPGLPKQGTVDIEYNKDNYEDDKQLIKSKIRDLAIGSHNEEGSVIGRDANYEEGEEESDNDTSSNKKTDKLDTKEITRIPRRRSRSPSLEEGQSIEECSKINGFSPSNSGTNDSSNKKRRKRVSSGWDAQNNNSCNSPSMIPTANITGNPHSYTGVTSAISGISSAATNIGSHSNLSVNSNHANFSVGLSGNNQSSRQNSQISRIYVGSLDYSLNEADLKQVFGSFGPIVNIDMPREGNRSKGFCFIEYTSQESAEMALATMNRFVLKGRPIRVGRPTNAVTNNSSSNSTQNSSNSGHGTSNHSNNHNHGSHSHGHSNPNNIQNNQSNHSTHGHNQGNGHNQGGSHNTSQSNIGANGINPNIATMNNQISHANHLIQSDSNHGSTMQGNISGMATHSQNRIYIGSVPYSFTTDDLRHIFKAFGVILSCQLIPSIEKPGTHRGYGFIEFGTADQAKLAIETMNGFEVGGKQLKVNVATALKPQNSNQSGISGASVNQIPIMPPIQNVMPSQIAPIGMPHQMVLPSMLPIPNVAPPPLPIYQQPPGYPINNTPAPFISNACSGPNSNSNIILLTNMVGPDEIDDELKEEVKIECSKYGKVYDVRIHVSNNISKPSDRVRIFVVFESPSMAQIAVPALNNRWFGGNQVFCSLYNTERYYSSFFDD